MSEDDWVEEERQELERMIQVLTERRDSIADDPDGYIIERMDTVYDSYVAVLFRYGNRPDISMWEHLHELLVNLETKPDEIVSKEIARIDSLIGGIRGN